VNLRRDHVAGGSFVLAGVLVLAVSSDLPFGTMASPGAGMLPMLLVGIMLAFGLVLFLRAGESPPLMSIAWDDLAHAIRVTAVTIAGIALYEGLGFVVTMALVLFTLTFIVERKHVAIAAALSVGVTIFACMLFGMLLKSPLPRGILGF
jgi:hypothetical protein